MHYTRAKYSRRFEPLSSIYTCLLFFSALLAAASPLHPKEKLKSAGQLIKNAHYVAHVRVEDSYSAAAGGKIREYRLAVLENIKGRLPSSIRVRIFTASHIIDTDGKLDKNGTEWIVILGKKNSLGIYPLLSLYWGKIEIFKDKRTGEKKLARKIFGLEEESVSGMPRGRRYSLKRFKELAKKAAKRK